MTTSTTSAAHLAALPAGLYRLDPELTTVAFTTRHMFGLGSVKGSFRLRRAELSVGNVATQTRVHAVLDAGSFDTATPKRDEQVASAKLLDSVAHPDITFTSGSITQQGETWIASGTVTAHGVSAPVDLVVDHFDDSGAQLKFSAGATIDRYAHGITGARGLAARHLDVRIDAVVPR